MVRTREREDLYRIAVKFVDVALRRDDSLFTPSVPVWSAEVLEDLYQKFVGRPDESPSPPISPAGSSSMPPARESRSSTRWSRSANGWRWSRWT